LTEKEFISKWVDILSKGLSHGKLKSFPSDFVGACESMEIKLPGTSLTLGDELFGSIEILDTYGKSVFMADSLSKAKYILYGSKNNCLSLQIPKDEKILSDTVKSYEKYLDGMLKEIESDFKKNFSELKNFPRISLEIFNTLDLRRY
jgi:hypothetical protein